MSQELCIYGMYIVVAEDKISEFYNAIWVVFTSAYFVNIWVYSQHRIRDGFLNDSNGQLISSCRSHVKSPQTNN